jgi:hypothetical protein
MYIFDDMVTVLAKEEIAKWEDNIDIRTKIFKTLTTGIPGLDTVDDLYQVADIVGRIPAEELKTITIEGLHKFGYKWA